MAIVNTDFGAYPKFRAFNQIQKNPSINARTFLLR